MNPNDGFSFGAYEAILSGSWDSYLPLLRFAIHKRLSEIKAQDG